jgi:serine phosphatase RsbU (regulator of sigma subunit)
VLDYLNKKLPENLKATGGEQTIRDGMDMSLCIFDFQQNKLQFSGANNPCYIVRNKTLIELKGDKQAISASTDVDKRNFTNQHFDIRPGDSVYLFTDGFADQFGGPDEKKFGYRRLRELLIEIAANPCEEQRIQLSEAFDQWKADLEQIDDVCIIGIKV